MFCQGMNCIRALPYVREESISISTKDLGALIHIIRDYLESVKKKTPPTKALLRKTILVLMQEETALSRQWDKTQLVLVVMK